MYSAEQTLDFFLLRYGHESHSEVLRIARFSSHLSEWIAHRRIEADQIATVTQYYLLRGNVHSNGQLPNTIIVGHYHSLILHVFSACHAIDGKLILTGWRPSAD